MPKCQRANGNRSALIPLTLPWSVEHSVENAEWRATVLEWSVVGARRKSAESLPAESAGVFVAAALTEDTSFTGRSAAQQPEDNTLPQPVIIINHFY